MSKQLAYVAALAAVLLSAAVALYTDVVAPKDLLIPALSLVSTFFGATFAFRLNQDKEARKLEAERRDALNRASFVLIRQWNAMDQIVRQFQAHPPPFARAFNMPAFKPPAYADLSLSLAELDFLIDSTNPGLLMDLFIEQERFGQALEALRIRNEFYVSELQPALARHELNHKTVTLEQMRALLGERIYETAVNGANIAWDQVFAASESIPKAHQALITQGKMLFPGKKLITFERAA